MSALRVTAFSLCIIISTPAVFVFLLLFQGYESMTTITWWFMFDLCCLLMDDRERGRSREKRRLCVSLEWNCSYPKRRWIIAAMLKIKAEDWLSRVCYWWLEGEEGRKRCKGSSRLTKREIDAENSTRSSSVECNSREMGTDRFCEGRVDELREDGACRKVGACKVVEWKGKEGARWELIFRK